MVWIDVQRNLWQRVSVAALGLHAVFSFKQIKGERKRQGKYQANGYRFGYCYCADNLTRFSVVQHTINSKYTLLTVGRKQKSCSGKVEMMQLFSLFTSGPWALKHFLRTLDDTSQATFLLLEVKKQNKTITNFVTGVFAFFFLLFFFSSRLVFIPKISHQTLTGFEVLQIAFCQCTKKASSETLIMQLGSFLSSMNVNIVSALIKETFFFF